MYCTIVDRRMTWACGLLALIGGLTVASSPEVANGQMTTEQLIGSAVAKIGPQYADVENAIALFRNGDFASAGKLLEVAKKKNPELPPAEVMLAHLLFSANQVAPGQASLERVALSAPEDPEPYNMFGDLALRTGQATVAEQMFLRGKELSKDFTRNTRRQKTLLINSLAGLAAVAEARQQWEQAQNALREWIEIDPESATAYERLGKTLFRQEKYQDAGAAFQMVHKLDDSKTLPEVNMAILYEQSGKRTEAKSLLENAVKSASQDIKTRLAAARWALDAGEMAMAKSNAEAALKIEPDSLTAKLILGMVARFEKRHEDAIKTFQEIHLQSPANFSAINNLALELVESDQQKDQDRAFEYAQVNARAYANEKSANTREAAVTLGWVLFRRGRELDAERTIQAALNLGGFSAESAYYVARILSDRNNAELAIRLLEPTLSLKNAFPHRPEAEKLLAELKKAAPKKEEPKK